MVTAMSVLRVFCKIGMHRWVGTLFIGDVHGVGRRCAWCGREELDTDRENGSER
jgi:hypothetical protein